MSTPDGGSAAALQQNIKKPSPEGEKVLGYLCKRNDATGSQGMAARINSCIACLKGKGCSGLGTDAKNLHSEFLLAATQGTAIREQQTGRIQFQGINANGIHDFRCLALFPHNWRATTGALDKKHFRIIATRGRNTGQGLRNSNDTFLHDVPPDWQ
jgi:hypothetical protein